MHVYPYIRCTRIQYGLIAPRFVNAQVFCKQNMINALYLFRFTFNSNSVSVLNITNPFICSIGAFTRHILARAIPAPGPSRVFTRHILARAIPAPGPSRVFTRHILARAMPAPGPGRAFTRETVLLISVLIWHRV